MLLLGGRRRFLDRFGKDTAEHWVLGGTSHISMPALPLKDMFSRSELPSIGNHTYLYSTKIPGPHGATWWLLVELRRNYISGYEKQVLKFIGADIGQILRSKESIKKEKENGQILSILFDYFFL